MGILFTGIIYSKLSVQLTCQWCFKVTFSNGYHLMMLTTSINKIVGLVVVMTTVMSNNNLDRMIDLAVNKDSGNEDISASH